jgi:hypothetical protein
MIETKLYRVMSPARRRGVVISPQKWVWPIACPARTAAPTTTARAAAMAAAVRRVRRVMSPS